MADPSNLRGTFSCLSLTKYDAIHCIYQRAEAALKEEVSGIAWKQMSQERVNQVRAYCDQMHQSIRQATFIALYSYLETDLELIGNHFFPDYKSKVDAEKNGDGTVNARLRVFEHSDISFTLNQDQAAIIDALRLIRNSLVHDAGWVGQGEQLKLTIKRVQREKKNCQLIEIRDGHIFLRKHFVALANSTFDSLVWHLYEAAAQRRGQTAV